MFGIDTTAEGKAKLPGAKTELLVTPTAAAAGCVPCLISGEAGARLPHPQAVQLTV